MNRFHRTFVLATLSLALALPIAALAWPGHGRGDHVQKKLEGLDLDADTRAQVETILEDGREARKARKENFCAERDAMRALMERSDASEAELLAQAERISELRLEMQKDRIASHLRLRALLTPGQMQDLKPDRRGRHGHDGDCKHRRHADR